MCDMFVMYCPEKKQYVKGVVINWDSNREGTVDFIFTDNVNEADQMLMEKNTNRTIKGFGYEFELKLRREL